MKKISMLDIAGAVVGASRAASLTDKEKEKLKEYHRLSRDASLPWRNAGRGFLGATGGTMVGIVPGLAAGNMGLAWGGAILGAGLGTISSTNKYSKSSPHLQKNASTAANMLYGAVPGAAIFGGSSYLMESEKNSPQRTKILNTVSAAGLGALFGAGISSIATSKPNISRVTTNTNSWETPNQGFDAKKAGEDWFKYYNDEAYKSSRGSSKSYRSSAEDFWSKNWGPFNSSSKSSKSSHSYSSTGNNSKSNNYNSARTNANKRTDFEDLRVDNDGNLYRGGTHIKTKAEYTKIKREMAKKHHPDVKGDAQKMKDFNNFKDYFEGSGFMDKMASLNYLVRWTSNQQK